MQNMSQSSDVVYHYMEHADIHELIFQQANRQAAEDGLEHIYRIYSTVSNDSKLRLMIDLRKSGMLPLNSVIRYGRDWNKRVTVHPKTRLAIILQGDSIMNFVQPIFNTLRFGHLQTKVLNGDSRDKAMEWLVQL